MESTSNDYIVADGLEMLIQGLENIYLKSQEDPNFSKGDHYILYRIGKQESLIKVDMKSRPYKFWYYDLLGRPATKIVKDTIARFLWERGENLPVAEN